jgi:hypothetical protein
MAPQVFSQENTDHERELHQLLAVLSQWDRLQGNPEYDPVRLDERAYFFHFYGIGQEVSLQIEEGKEPNREMLTAIYKKLHYQRETLIGLLVESGFTASVANQAIDTVYERLITIAVPNVIEALSQPPP